MNDATAVLRGVAEEHRWVSGAPQGSATGMCLYVLTAGILFILATVTAAMLARKRFGGEVRSAPSPSRPPRTVA